MISCSVQKGLDHGAKSADPMDSVRQMWTEILVRQLLRLPQRPMLLWLGAGWRAFSDERGGNATLFPSRHQCTIAAQEPVLRHYGVPQVSLVEAFMPVTTAARMKWMSNVYFVDRLHPSVLAHKFVASVVAYNLLDHPIEVHVMNSSIDYASIVVNDSAANRANVPRPALMLPKPITVSSHMAKTYEATFERLVLSDPTVVAAAAVPLSLKTEPRLREPVESKRPTFGSGFSIYEDVPNKPGLIATSAGASVILRLSPPKVPKSAFVHSKNVYRPWLVIVLGYLSSYSNMAAFEIEVAALAGTCPAESGWEPEADASFVLGRVDGLISEHVSIYTTKVFSGRLPQQASIHTVSGPAPCILLRARVLRDEPSVDDHSILIQTGLKVKLYDISWTWTEEDLGS